MSSRAETEKAPDCFAVIEDIYSKYKKLMFATARKYTDNISDQEDIIQTVLEKLLKTAEGSDMSNRPISASYIVYTVRSVSIDLLRKQGRDGAFFLSMEDDQLAQAAGTEGTLDDLLLSIDRSQNILAVWSKVPLEDRILLEGKYIFGLNDQELALTLGCNPNTIRMKLTRARRRCAKVLLERSEDPV